MDLDALWLELHSSFASTIAFHTRLISCNISRSFWNWQLLPPLESKKSKQNIILSNSTFCNVSTVFFVMFLLSIGVTLRIVSWIFLIEKCTLNSGQSWGHLWPYPIINTDTLLMWPNFYGLLVTMLTWFHCIVIKETVR